MGLVEFHESLGVDRAVHLFIVIWVHLNRFNNLDRVPIGIEYWLRTYEYAAQDALADQLSVREIDLLSSEIVEDLQVRPRRVFAQGFLRIIIEKEKVIRQDVMLEDLLQLGTENQR